MGEKEVTPDCDFRLKDMVNTCAERTHLNQSEFICEAIDQHLEDDIVAKVGGEKVDRKMFDALNRIIDMREPTIADGNDVNLSSTDGLDKQLHANLSPKLSKRLETAKSKTTFDQAQLIRRTNLIHLHDIGEYILSEKPPEFVYVEEEYDRIMNEMTEYQNQFMAELSTIDKRLNGKLDNPENMKHFKVFAKNYNGKFKDSIRYEALTITRQDELNRIERFIAKHT